MNEEMIIGENIMTAEILKDGGNDHNNADEGNGWLRNLSKLITTIEDDGMFGLAQTAIHLSTNLAVSVASTVIGTAIHALSDASSRAGACLENVPSSNPNDCVYLYDDEEEALQKQWTKSCHENVISYVVTKGTYNPHCDGHANRDDSPFGILSIASAIADIMLGAISPLLVQQRHQYAHTTRIDMNDQRFLRRRVVKGAITSAGEKNSIDEYSDIGQFFDAEESCCRSSAYVESVYFDATSTTRSLSTTDSFMSSDDAEETSRDGSENGSAIRHNILEEAERTVSETGCNIPQQITLSHDEIITDDTSCSTQAFHLDLSEVLSEDEQDVITSTNEECIYYKGSSAFYIIRDSITYQNSFRIVLDALVKRSMCIAQLNNEYTLQPSLKHVVHQGEVCWNPDDRTKKYMERRHENGIASEEWTRTLENDVLKWTGSLHNSNCPMLRTCGVIRMAPQELKELLLDCERNHLYNQNSVSKTNIHCFADNPNIGGETRIVKNVMKIPIVGGTIQTVSLTHARRIENGGYLLVSQSIGETEDTAPTNPYFSISILRSVPNCEQKTELTNVTQISSMPIPKFLMQKVGLIGVMDFFKNLRSLCK